MNKVHCEWGWFYFRVFTFRILPKNKDTWELFPVDYFKVGLTDGDRRVLERGV